MKIDWIKELENIKKRMELGESYESIGRHYFVTGNSIKKGLKKYGVELERKRIINPNETFNRGKTNEIYCENCGKKIRNPKKGRKFCSIKCQQNLKYKLFIEKWKNNETNGVIGEYGISQNIRKYLKEKFGNKCQICGWGETNIFTGNVPLEVHHIDGDYRNNKEENLQLLCPNCHSLTETFKNSNKNGRKGRKKYS